MKGRVLVVEDDVRGRELLVEDLASDGFEVFDRASAEAAVAFLEQNEVDAVVSDLRLEGMSGVELCERLRDQKPDLPVVLITGFGTVDWAVKAMRAGAYDFISKPFEREVLTFTLQRAVNHHRLRAELDRLRRHVSVPAQLTGLVGESAMMSRVFDVITQAAPTDASVLITGESGTGKELVARALHEQSRRKDGPFVALNCAAVPETLLESQLFGHVRGAFTDAKSSQRGLILESSGGTLFLDEIGDMPVSLQPKMLRVLQERCVRPLGATDEIEVDVRVLAATNADIENKIRSGAFREDLYYRINVIQLDLPPLRERGNDVLLLATHFLSNYASRQKKSVTGFSRAAAEKLLSYGWPGNVRELQNCIERAVALTTAREIQLADLAEKVRNFKASDAISVSGALPDELLSLEDVERRHILHVFESTGHNRGKTAELLGISRRTLFDKLRKYGLSQ